MPIWGEVELLCRAIAEEGRQAADKVLNQAQTEAQDILNRAGKQALREIRLQEENRSSELHMEAKQIVDAAEVEARQRLMTFQEETVQELLSNLEEFLNGLRSHPEYAAFLSGSVREGLDRLPGKEFIVELNPADLPVIRNEAESISRQRSCRIRLEASERVHCGALIYTEDRRLLYDNTVSARLKRHAETVRREIWRTIFANESSTV